MKKHSKAVTLIVLAAVACVMFVMYRIMSANSDVPNSSETHTDQHYVLANSVSDKATGLTYVADGDELSFTKDKSGWRYTDDSNFPLDSEKVDEMLKGISAIVVYKDVESGDNGEFGFDKPSLTVRIAYDGGNAEYVFGDINTFTGCRYLKTSWDGKVYLVDDDVTEYFGYTLSGLIKRDTIPAGITKTTVFSFRLVLSDKANDIEDEKGVSALAAQFMLIGTGSVADYYADDTEFNEKYMIGDGGSLTVKYYVTVKPSDGSTSSTKTEKEFTVVFGTHVKDENDDYVYFVLPDSRIVYTLSYDTYSNIMSYITYYVTK